MARRIPLLSIRSLNEINMTPLIDLAFLLLITFIITFPMLEQGIPINLPKVKAEEIKHDKQKSHTVSIDERGGIFLENVKVSLEQLTDKMNAFAKGDPDTVVMVRADERVRYGHVARVLRVIHQAKITKMSLVTKPEENTK